MVRYIVIATILIGVGSFLYFNKNAIQPNKKTPQEKAFKNSITAAPTTEIIENKKSFVGKIVKMTETGFVVKNKDGSLDTIIIANSTKYVGGDKPQLTVNKEVLGFGEVTKNGDITAHTIQFGPKPFKKPAQNSDE